MVPDLHPARLDAYLAEHSPAALLSLICTAAMDGTALDTLAAQMGVNAGTMRKWVRDDPERLSAYREALRIRADALVHESLEIIDKAAADPEMLAVCKARADHRLKVAPMWDRELAGKQDGSGGGGNTGVAVTFVVQGVAAPVRAAASEQQAVVAEDVEWRDVGSEVDDG